MSLPQVGNKMNLGKILIGKPLRTEEAVHQAITKPVALAVFASDALSSTAYATQEILIVLAAAAVIAGADQWAKAFPVKLDWTSPPPSAAKASSGATLAAQEDQTEKKFQKLIPIEALNHFKC